MGGWSASGRIHLEPAPQKRSKGFQSNDEHSGLAANALRSRRF